MDKHETLYSYVFNSVRFRKISVALWNMISLILLLKHWCLKIISWFKDKYWVINNRKKSWRSYVCVSCSVMSNSSWPRGLYACQAPVSMEFSRQEWRGLPFPSPGNLPDPGIEPRCLKVQEGPCRHLSQQGSPCEGLYKWLKLRRASLTAPVVKRN